MTEKRLQSLLVAHEIVPSSAFFDPEGYDGGRTAEYVRQLLEDLNDEFREELRRSIANT